MLIRTRIDFINKKIRLEKRCPQCGHTYIYKFPIGVFMWVDKKFAERDFKKHAEKECEETPFDVKLKAEIERIL